MSEEQPYVDESEPVERLFGEEMDAGLDGYRLQLFGHYREFPSYFPGSVKNKEGDKEDWTDKYGGFINAVEAFQEEHNVLDVQFQFSANDSGLYHEAWILYEPDDIDEVKRQ